MVFLLYHKMLIIETLVFKNRIQCGCRLLNLKRYKVATISEECTTLAIIILKYASLKIQRIAVNNTLL